MLPTSNGESTFQSHVWVDCDGGGPTRGGGRDHQIVFPVFENPRNIGVISRLFCLMKVTRFTPFEFRVMMTTTTTRKCSQYRTDLRLIVSDNVLEINVILPWIFPLFRPIVVIDVMGLIGL